VGRLEELLTFAATVKGFMPLDEGQALTDAALEAGRRHPAGTWVEVGAYCGKSAVYLGAAAEATSSVFYSLDHHHGSEENQSGWEHHDTTLIDAVDGRLNTLPQWQRTIADAEFLAFPRLAAIAEIGWSARNARAWEDFRLRLAAHGPRLQALGVNFYRSPQIPWP